MGANTHPTVVPKQNRTPDDETIYVVVDRRDSWNITTVGYFKNESDAQEVANREEYYSLRERTAYGSVKSFDNE